MSNNPFGVNLHLLSEAKLHNARELGVGWARTDVLWGTIHKGPHQYDFSSLDSVMHLADTYCVKLLANVQGTPSWATRGPAFSGVPNDMQTFQDFCAILVRRYPQIRAVGIWNEPNLKHFWRGSMAEYGKLLEAGSAGVRSGTVGMVDVVGPELAHLRGWHKWLKYVLETHGDVIDVVGHHCYSKDLQKELWDGSIWPWDAPSVWDVITKSGWKGPLWLTETGFSSKKDEMHQATKCVEMLMETFPMVRGHATKELWIDKLFYYQLEDDGTSTGLVQMSGQRKLAFALMAGYIEMWSERWVNRT